MPRNVMPATRSKLFHTGITCATFCCRRSSLLKRKCNSRSSNRMNTPNPIDLLFGDMDKLSPGDDSLSLYILRSLPEHRFEVVVDAGCGAGRQTFVLADELKTPIHAVDSYQPFLDRLIHRAKEKGLAELMRTHCMDMKDIPTVFPTIDLLWAE